ncbi:ABC transporter, ATP-binding protein [Actinomyces sp. oral taxon 848 str. F0332]|nr:ABC transporter, ATP-binding protein [Actinomyces sp. oral taxon 848 str. F0332]
MPLYSLVAFTALSSPCAGGSVSFMRESLSKDSNNQILVEGTDLTKAFGSVRALDGLDLSVKAGSVHGFLGPNGAGKTTAIRAILGQIRLDGGRLRVFGRDPVKDAVDVHRRLAYVPGDTVLWPNLTGGECIDILGRMQGSIDAARRAELIERFELNPRMKTRTYSKGNRQKVALVAALATRAELLLLDEPTSGLDPVMAERFVETVREAQGSGATVLLSSHIMSEVAALCDTVTVLRRGRAAYSGSLEGVRARADVAVSAVGRTGEPISLNVPSAEADSAVAGLLKRGASIRKVESSLEAAFLSFYGGEK